jgi:hypothetical protein
MGNPQEMGAWPTRKSVYSEFRFALVHQGDGFEPVSIRDGRHSWSTATKTGATVAAMATINEAGAGPNKQRCEVGAVALTRGGTILSFGHDEHCLAAPPVDGHGVAAVADVAAVGDGALTTICWVP